jgi:hypothetical protein
LEGPAEFRLDGPDRAFLSHGRLTAAVPPAAIGFRIHTPVLDVTDRGTAFGMTVAPSGSSEVMVFQGEVEVDSPDDDQPSQRLLEGSAARAITAHQGPQPAEFDVRPYERAWPMTFGVIGATGVVRFVRPGPKVFPRKIEDNDHLIVIPEREAVTLKEPVIVSITEPGHYDGPFFGLAETLPAGARVRSYLLQFNPVGRLPIVRELIGSITFDRPVLGLIVNSDQLGETDAPLGAEGSAPMGWIARGIEAGDSIELTADRRTLNIYWTAAAGVDQVRVVVAAPE